MRLGKDARDPMVTFSITMPGSLYDQLKPYIQPGKRSELVCDLIKAAFAMDPLLNRPPDKE